MEIKPGMIPEGFTEYWAEWDATFLKQGHRFKLDEDGEIDRLVCNSGFHEGPGCSVCGESFCQHCYSPDEIPSCKGPGKYTIEGTVVDRRTGEIV